MQSIVLQDKKLHAEHKKPVLHHRELLPSCLWKWYNPQLHWHECRTLAIKKDFTVKLLSRDEQWQLKLLWHCKGACFNPTYKIINTQTHRLTPLPHEPGWYIWLDIWCFWHSQSETIWQTCVECTRLCVCLCVCVSLCRIRRLSDMGADMDRQSTVPDVIRVGPVVWPLTLPDGDNNPSPWPEIPSRSAFCVCFCTDELWRMGQKDLN